MYGECYAGQIEIDDYKVSPLWGDLTNLPPTSIFAGTYDILYADTKSLDEKLDQLNIQHNLFIYPKLFHVFVAVTFLKESKLAIEQIAELLNGL